MKNLKTDVKIEPKNPGRASNRQTVMSEQTSNSEIELRVDSSTFDKE